jgi:hypothetical protein
MSLDNFFRINLPYGLRRVSKNKWVAFNREYLPLGWNTGSKKRDSIFDPKYYEDIPIHTAYEGLTEKLLLAVTWDDKDGVQRDDNGQINSVFFYNDRSNPANNPQMWPEYFEKIKLLANLTVKRSEVTV